MMPTQVRNPAVACVAWLLCIAMACSSKGPTVLCDGFQSYSSPQEVRNHLRASGIATPWRETTGGLPSSDPRPPFRTLSISGPYVLSGIEGNLELVFYNDRLISAQFSTQKGRDLLAAMQQKHAKVPVTSARESGFINGLNFNISSTLMVATVFFGLTRSWNVK